MRNHVAPKSTSLVVRTRRPAVVLAVALAVALGASALAAAALTLNPATPTKTEYDRLADAPLGDYTYAGAAVAIQGDRALLSAGGYDDYRGAALSMTRAGTDWTFNQLIQSAETTQYDRFPSAIALDGDTVAFGTHTIDGYRGKTFIYTHTGSGWVHQQTLSDPGVQENDSFGVDVALDGDTLLVGESGKSFPSDNTGATFVYRKVGVTWTPEATLTAGGSQSFFGCSMALEGDTAVIGAYSANDLKGAAFVFTRSGSTWSQVATLTSPEGATSGGFGQKVALDGNTVAVQDRDSREVCVFTGSGSSWSLQATMGPGPGAPYTGWGRDIALEGDTLVISADAEDSNTGAAYVYTRKGTTWTERARLVSSTRAADEYFGASVAISGPQILVTAVMANANGALSGEVFAYKVNPPSTALGIAAADGDAGWYRTPPTIALVPSESGRTSYRWGTSPNWSRYGVAFPAEEGNRTLEYVSEDIFGNSEATRSVPVRVDSGAPVGLALINDGAASTNSLSAQLAVHAWDSVSGLGWLRYNSGSGFGTWMPFSASVPVALSPYDGMKTVAVEIRDIAGNRRSLSDQIRFIRPKAAVGTPKLSVTSPRKGRYFTCYGYITQQVTGNTRMYLYRKVGDKWVRYTGGTAKYLNASNSAYGSKTKYSRRLKLPYKGKWYVRPYYPGGPSVAPNWGSKRYFTVKS